MRYKRLEVSFLNINLCTNISPTPITGQVQPSQNPSLKLFPGIFGKEGRSEFLFDLVEPLTSLDDPIAINTQYEDIHHRVSFGDLPQALQFQRLVNTPKQRVLTNPNSYGTGAKTSEKTREKWLENVLVLAKVFGDNEDIHSPVSPSLLSPSEKASMSSIHPVV